jgi:hypothetical protein
LLVRLAKILFDTDSGGIAAIRSINKSKTQAMKRIILIGLAVVMFAACASPKAYYETKEGKRKQKYYNDIQFGRDAHPKRKF